MIRIFDCGAIPDATTSRNARFFGILQILQIPLDFAENDEILPLSSDICKFPVNVGILL